jgi:hypothetical protein
MKTKIKTSGKGNMRGQGGNTHKLARKSRDREKHVNSFCHETNNNGSQFWDDNEGHVI